MQLPAWRVCVCVCLWHSSRRGDRTSCLSGPLLAATLKTRPSAALSSYPPFSCTPLPTHNSPFLCIPHAVNSMSRQRGSPHPASSVLVSSVSTPLFHLSSEALPLSTHLCSLQSLSFLLFCCISSDFPLLHPPFHISLSVFHSLLFLSSLHQFSLARFPSLSSLLFSSTCSLLFAPLLFSSSLLFISSPLYLQLCLPFLSHQSF